MGPLSGSFVGVMSFVGDVDVAEDGRAWDWPLGRRGLWVGCGEREEAGWNLQVVLSDLKRGVDEDATACDEQSMLGLRRNFTRAHQEHTDLYRDVWMAFNGACVALLEGEEPHG